ncbi:DUF4397 domain-containing protein [Rugosimonospora africana]|uniref:Cell wall anchor n=1 Tax=Rugosimonospora africana TaxID=556532 RepID=A0A8J3QQG3_9ACTN|nr:DUF4397 domain-containing protein [Rugosimonospora africana]GIH14641.1 cell wall anchor [Rugosimonospora africana]
MSASVWRRRLGILALTSSLVFGLAFGATPSGAAGAVGYVRLAHLSPDTPDVDVYLSSVSGGSPQVFPGVGYGTVSTYLTVPTGTYAVAMRAAGAPATDPPVLTTNVTVADGRAYTVAGVGTHAALGLKVIDDDLSLPPAGKSKVRIIQASLRAPVLNVWESGGQNIAGDIAFATTTDYREVAPGGWTIEAQGTGGGPACTLHARLGAGNVYSLIVLDGKSGGLTSQLRADALGGGRVPTGGVATGGGGTQRHDPPFPAVGLAVSALVAAGGFAVAARRRLVRG